MTKKQKEKAISQKILLEQMEDSYVAKPPPAVPGQSELEDLIKMMQ